MANGDNEKRIQELEAQLKKQKSNFRNFGQEMADAFSNAFGNAESSVSSMGEAAVGQLTRIRDLSSQIAKNQEKIDSYGKSSTSNFSEVDKLNQQIAKNQEKIKKTLDQQSQSGKKMSSEQKKKLKKFKEQNKELQNQAKQLEVQNQHYALMQKQISGVGGVFSAMAKVPLVGRLIDAGGAMKKMQETLKKTKNSTLAVGAGFGHIVKSGALAGINALIGAALKSIISLDQGLVNVGKQMDMNTEAAAKYAAEVNKGNDNIRHSRDRMWEAQTMMNQMRGLREKMTDEDLQQSVEILQSKMLEGAELTRIMQLSKIHSKTLKQTLHDQLKAIKVVEKQNKISLDYQKILKKTATMSGDLRAIIGMVPEEMAAAVAQATSLGMEIDSLTSITDNLLNFESSIAKELEAELLTGKQLNLEKARMAALVGDEATLMAELNANFGSYAEWNAQTVLAKQAQAAALGMTMGQMEEIFLKQQDIANSEALQNEVKEEQTLQNMTQVDLMTTLSLTLEKAAETLQNKMLPHITKITDIFKNFEKIGKRVKNLIRTGIVVAIGMMAMNLARAILNFGRLVMLAKKAKKLSVMEAIAEAWKTGMKVPGNAATFGILGASIAVGLTAAILAAVATADTGDDVFSAPSGYGKRMLTGPEGSLALNDNDFVMATTNPENLIQPAPTQAPNTQGNTSALMQKVLESTERQNEFLATIADNSTESLDKESIIEISSPNSIEAVVQENM